MRVHRGVRVLMFLPLVVAFVALLGLVLMALWNWLMPSLFGLPPIGYWQALGVFVLSKLLFGGLRGSGHHDGRWRRRMRERWETMTPAERERFRQEDCGRWAGVEPPSPEPGTQP